MNVVEFKNVDIIFGDNPQKAVKLLDSGMEREAILEETGNTIGVHNASITVKQGEICVLMGLSGSGKSTLLRTVNGLNRPTRGQVLVNDGQAMVDVASCDKATLHRLRSERVSMVFQQFALLPWRTVKENVGLGLELKGVPKAEREPIVQEKLKLVHLEQWGDKYAHELSGGMQQRVGLARAFATDADILLMDEPFSALDPLIRNHLQDELIDLQSSLNKTIIFVSHDLEEAVKLGSHIGIMKNGKVVQYGRPTDIILSPADDYVQAFVAHLNPINLFSGSTLMTPLEQLPQTDGKYALNQWETLSLTLDASGRPEVLRDGKPLAISRQTKESLLSSDVMENTVIIASADLDMKSIMECYRISCFPILIETGGKIAGIVGSEEIFKKLLHTNSSG